MTPSEARKALGMSIHDMALVMGVHRQTWTKWERGERRPDNAAARLMELLVWLHQYHEALLTDFRPEHNTQGSS